MIQPAEGLLQPQVYDGRSHWVAGDLQVGCGLVPRGLGGKGRRNYKLGRDAVISRSPPGAGMQALMEL